MSGERIHQNFSGERLTHEFLNLNIPNFIRLFMDNNLSPRVVIHIRENHLQRYTFADDRISSLENHRIDGNVKVLDLACGIGYGSNIISKQGRRIIGIDKSYLTIKEADQCYGSSNRHFLAGDGIGLPFPDDSFNIITCFETIEHMESPERMLREASRILNPSGELYISTPNRVVTNPSSTSADKPPNKFHKHEYNEEELRNLLSRFFYDVDIMGQEQYADKSSMMERVLYHLGEPGLFAIKMRDMINLHKTARVEVLKPAYKPTYFVAVCKNKK